MLGEFVAGASTVVRIVNTMATMVAVPATEIKAATPAARYREGADARVGFPVPAGVGKCGKPHPLSRCIRSAAVHGPATKQERNGAHAE